MEDYGWRATGLNAASFSWDAVSRILFFVDADQDEDVHAFGIVCGMLLNKITTNDAMLMSLREDGVHELDRLAWHRLGRIAAKCFCILDCKARQWASLLLSNEAMCYDRSPTLANIVRLISTITNVSSWPSEYGPPVVQFCAQKLRQDGILFILGRIVRNALDETQCRTIESTVLESIVMNVAALVVHMDSQTHQRIRLQSARGAFDLLSLPSIPSYSSKLAHHGNSFLLHCIPFLEQTYASRASDPDTTTSDISSPAFHHTCGRFIQNVVSLGTKCLSSVPESRKQDQHRLADAVARFMIFIVDRDLDTDSSQTDEMSGDNDDDAISTDLNESVINLSPSLRSCIEALRSRNGQQFLLTIGDSLLDTEFMNDDSAMTSFCELLYLTICSTTDFDQRQRILLSLSMSGRFLERLWRGYIQRTWNDLRASVPDKQTMETLLAPLCVLCEVYASFLNTAGKHEICRKQIPLTLSDVYGSNGAGEGLVTVLKNCMWKAVRLMRGVTIQTSSVRSIMTSEFPRICGRLLVQLSENSSRWNLAPAEDFHLSKDQLLSFMMESPMAALQRAIDKDANDVPEKRTTLILKHAPCLVPFRERAQIFQSLLDRERSSHPVAANMFADPTVHARIRRHRLFEDGFEQLGNLKCESLRSRIRVEFVDGHGMMEAGVDGGGLFKDFLEELVKQGYEPEKGYFKETDQHELYPNPAATADPKALDVFGFLGRMLGKAIFDGILVELPFTHFFLKKLLNLTCDFHDLPSLDSEVYDSLIQLRSHDWNDADLGLRFTITDNSGGLKEEVDLKPNGKQIPVTQENVVEYIYRFADYRLNQELKKTSQRFVDGFFEVIQPEWMQLFNATELRMVISGAVRELDLVDLREHTNYLGGYDNQHPVVVQLWEILDEFSNEERGRFLRFVTGCSRAPLLGFERLQPSLSIQRAARVADQSERLPTSATCMNLLKLPEYSSKELMKEKLLYAISSNAGFDLS